MTTARKTSAGSPASVKRPRGEGQWALGYREPLNPNEQFKKDDDALNVRGRIVDIYSKQGFDSIDKQDLRGRMRWMGLYTQREQGYDGTWTSAFSSPVTPASQPPRAAARSSNGTIGMGARFFSASPAPRAARRPRSPHG